MVTTAILAHKVSKTYHSAKGGEVKALSEVSLSVPEGEIFAFLGPNGSGKTTIINILSGVLDPDPGGEVRISIRGLSREDPGYFDRVSFMSGDSEYFWSFSGEEILRFYARLVGASRQRLADLIDEFGLGDKIRRNWIEYSNGEKTRLRLIRALLKEPEVLFLDEPTVGLDPDVSNLVREKLRALNRSGLTVFLTSHYMKDIEELAHTVCFIHEGRIHAQGPLRSFRRAKPFVQIEYMSGRIESVALDTVGQIVLAEEVRTIRSEEESLEDYFVAMTRGEK